MLVKLPHHILEDVLRYCDRTDKFNISCTNTKHRELLIPFIWRNVDLTGYRLSFPMPDDRRLVHLKFTSSLTLFNRLGTDRRKESHDECLVNYSMNVTKILHHVNPFKVSRLSLGFSYSEYLTRQVLKTFPCLQRLELSHIDLKQWEGVVLGKTLKHLQVRWCNIPDTVLSDIFSRNKLETLQFTDCPLITTDGFKDALADDLLNITRYSYTNIELCVNLKIDGSGCIRMVKLLCLSLCGVAITDEILRQLCKNLVQLQVLELSLLPISHEAFRDIQLLSKLRSLQFHGWRMSSNIFGYIKSSVSLNSLEFYADDLTYDDTYSDMSKLSKMASLSKVKFHSKNNDISVRVLGKLCETCPWNLVVDDENDEDFPVIYFLTK